MELDTLYQGGCNGSVGRGTDRMAGRCFPFLKQTGGRCADKEGGGTEWRREESKRDLLDVTRN